MAGATRFGDWWLSDRLTTGVLMIEGYAQHNRDDQFLRSRVRARWRVT
jgi:hypothetical protein